MTTKISNREWEALSAYLDGQLSSRDRTRLEESLKERAELRAALDELRRTHLVLRSQAGMRAPRNFILTPEMAGIKRARPALSPLFPVMRFATVLAAAIFVLVLAGDFLTRGQEPALFQVASRSSVVNQPMMAAPLSKSAGEYPAPTQAPAATSVSPAQQAAGIAPQPTATPPSLELQSLPQGYPPPAAAPPAGLYPSQNFTGTASSALPVTPTLSAQEDMLSTQAAAESAPMREASQSPGWAAWRILELAFALVALGAGILAFYLWRASRI
jgi:hypothetical protein